MRSPWRVPRRSAERRAARDKSRCRAADELRKFAYTCLCCADMDGAPIGAPPPFFVRMISSENRTPLFGIVRGEASFFVRLVVRKARMQRRIARMILFVSASRAKWRREPSPLIPAKAGIQSGSAFAGTSGEIGRDSPHAHQISERHAMEQWRRTPFRIRYRLLAFAINNALGHWRSCADRRCRRARGCQDHECYWRRLEQMTYEEQMRMREAAAPLAKLLWIGCIKGSEGRPRF